MNDTFNKKHRRIARIGYFVIALIAVLPLISALSASLLGWCLGCSVNEAGTNDCIRWNINFGETLSTMFILGWALMFTIPLAIMLLIAWIIYINKKVKQ